MSVSNLAAAHLAAWKRFQMAFPGAAAGDAEDDMQEALHELCCTPVTCAEDVHSLLNHLDWHLKEEGEAAEDLPRAVHAALFWGQRRGAEMAVEVAR